MQIEKLEKQDGVSPVDNRPSTEELQKIVQNSF